MQSHANESDLPPPPLVAPQLGPFEQPHLNPAPEGVDARFAWGFPGGRGQNVDLIDIEQGWVFDHLDLQGRQISLVSGVDADFRGHGTAVLGLIAAVDNDRGVTGIAPEIGSLRTVSQWRAENHLCTACAIEAAVAALNPGGVLLLEAQTMLRGIGVGLPSEAEPVVLKAIQSAVARGITVVEAAGDGGLDLRVVRQKSWGHFLDPGSPDFRDSGAILVGAATARSPHSRIAGSTYGRRIDCFAWGEHVVTTGDGFQGEQIDDFTDTFGGTSAAAAIVAGVAVVVQGIAKARLGRPLEPAELRDLLRDPANGTASASPDDLIGVMPDLQKIIAKIPN